MSMEQLLVVLFSVIEIFFRFFPGDSNNNPSPQSLPETTEEFIANRISGAEYSDPENNTILLEQVKIMILC